MGENDYKPNPINVDPRAYQYGGPGGAAAAVARLRGQQDFDYGKQKEYGGQQQHLYNRGNEQMDRGNDAFAQQGLSRQRQVDMQDLMARRARGEGPSIAQQQADRQLAQLGRLMQTQNRDVEAAQASAAAGARGPAALALAQQAQAANTAAGQTGIARMGTNAAQSISEAAQVNAARERLDAERAALAGAGAIRQGDQGAAGLGYQSAGTAFGAGAQAGQLGIQSGQLGLGNAGLQHQIDSTQMMGNMRQQELQSRNELGIRGIEAGVAGQNAAQDQQDFWNTVDVAVGGAGALLGGALSISDEQAKIPILDGNVPNAGPGRVYQEPGQPTWGVGRFQRSGGFELAPGEEAPQSGEQRTLDEQLDTYHATRAKLAAADANQAGAARALYGNAEAGDASFLDEPTKLKPAGHADDPNAKAEAQRGMLGSMQGSKSKAKPAGSDAVPAPKKEPSKWEKAGNIIANKLGRSGGYGRNIDVSYHAPAFESDEQAKDPIGFGPVSAGIEMGSDAVTSPTYDAIAPGGGMDVMGSLKRHSANATRFVRNPGAPPIASGMYQKDPGSGMYQKDPGSGMYQKQPRSDERAKRPEPTSTRGLSRFREVSDADMAQANRDLQGYPYSYKAEHRPDEQAPGETNVGPMAQRMAQNKVTRTAVKRDPETGMLALDRDKMIKVQASGLASLQKQVDGLARKLRKGGE